MNYKNTNKYRIGEIYVMYFDGIGNEQSGWRPGLVFQNNVGNDNSPNIIALPLTSSLKKANQPTHVIIPADGNGLFKDSMVLCENPQRMSKDRIKGYITTLSDEYLEEVATASILASSAISYIDPTKLLTIWQKAFKLNNSNMQLAS